MYSFINRILLSFSYWICECLFTGFSCLFFQKFPHFLVEFIVFINQYDICIFNGNIQFIPFKMLQSLHFFYFFCLFFCQSNGIVRIIRHTINCLCLFVIRIVFLYIIYIVEWYIRSFVIKSIICSLIYQKSLNIHRIATTKLCICTNRRT